MSKKQQRDPQQPDMKIKWILYIIFLFVLTAILNLFIKLDLGSSVSPMF